MHVRTVRTIFIDIHAHYALAKGVCAGYCHGPNDAQTHLRQQNHRVPPPGPSTAPFVFFESIHTRTVFSSSFTETSSVSPCTESMRSPATRSNSSFFPESSASTTDIGIFTST